MMNLKKWHLGKWHLEKYQELRYLLQQIARNEAEASGQQSRDQQWKLGTTWKSTKNWDTFCNKLLEMKPKQVVNNRVINSALIELLRFRENLTSIAH